MTLAGRFIFSTKKGANPRVAPFLLLKKWIVEEISSTEKLKNECYFKACAERETAVYLGVNEDFEFKRNAEIASLFGFSYNLALIAFDSSS